MRNLNAKVLGYGQTHELKNKFKLKIIKILEIKIFQSFAYLLLGIDLCHCTIWASILKFLQVMKFNKNCKIVQFAVINNCQLFH